MNSGPNTERRRIALEVPVFNYQDARNASTMGAKSIELNAVGSYEQGGLTPSMEMFMGTVTAPDVSLRIMIRPRGPPAEGPDFIYTDEEFRQMRESILEFKATNRMQNIRLDGFVFGILKYVDTVEGRKLVVDVGRCNILTQLAAPFDCIYHRAFDTIAASSDQDLKHGLDDLRRAGMTGLLTSGGPGSYMDNLGCFRRILRHKHDKISLIIGGGVRSDNIEAALGYLNLDKTGTWFHSSCITGGEPVVDDAELIALASTLGLDFVD